MILSKIQQAALLELMDIPVWRLIPPKLPVEIIKDCPQPNMLLIVGRQGTWEQFSSDHKASHLLMMERLVKALKRDFNACTIAEFRTEIFPDRLLKNIAQTGIEKVIIFGKNLGYFLGVESSFNSKITILSTPEEEKVSLAVIPALELLESDPVQKKEAWGCLAPMWMKA